MKTFCRDVEEMISSMPEVSQPEKDAGFRRIASMLDTMCEVVAQGEVGMSHFHEDHMIIVDGRQTWLLSYKVSDSGVLITVSGPKVLVLHQHEITELDGSPVKLNDWKKHEHLRT